MIGSTESSPASLINSNIGRLNFLQIPDYDIGTNAGDIYADSTEMPHTFFIHYMRRMKKTEHRRQYNPDKPCKWNFKNLVSAVVSGIIYDFLLYANLLKNKRLWVLEVK